MCSLGRASAIWCARHLGVESDERLRSLLMTVTTVSIVWRMRLCMSCPGLCWTASFGATSHMGETFCFADPQVEGRGVLRIWVYDDTDNALVSSDQQLRDCDVVDPGCDGESTIKGRYVYTATDGVCGLSGHQVDSFHDGVIECMDVSIDRKHAVTSTMTQQPMSIAIGRNRLLFQPCSSGTLNASCDTRFDRDALAVEHGLDAGSGNRKVNALSSVLNAVMYSNA